MAKVTSKDSWGTCNPPRFDAVEEAEELLLLLITHLKTMGLEARSFPGLGAPVQGCVARRIPVIPIRENPTQPPTIDEFIFYTVPIPAWRSPCAAWFGAAAQGRIAIDLFRLSASDDVEAIMDQLSLHGGSWPIAWRVKAFKTSGIDDVYLEMMALPYLLRELSYIVIRSGDLLDLYVNSDSPMTIRRSTLTERTSASRTFETLISRKIKPFTGVPSEVARLATVLRASVASLIQANRNWNRFLVAISRQEKMTCPVIPLAPQLSLEDLARDTRLPPNGVLSFTSGEDFTVFFDLFYGRTSVFVEPVALDQGGLDRMRHTAGVLADQVRAGSKKSRVKKQTIVLEKPHGQEENA